MKNFLILSGSVFSALAVYAAAPAIDAQNVSITQDDDRLVTVSYELSGADAIVTVDFLTNGVSIGEANFADVAGDVNRVVNPGSRKIFWRADRTWSGHSVEAEFTAVVKAWPLSSPPDVMVIDLMARISPAKKSLRFYVSEDALPDGGLANDARYAGECMVFKKVRAAGKSMKLGCPAAYVSDMPNADLSVEYTASFTNDYYLGIYSMTISQCKKFWDNSVVRGLYSNENRWYDDSMKYEPLLGLSYRLVRGTVRGYNWPLDGEEDGVRVDAYEVDETFTWGVGQHKTCVKALRAISGLSRVDLPTRAQWEFACRAGSPFNFYQLEGDIAYDTLTGYLTVGNPEYSFALRIGWTDATARDDGDRSYRSVGLKEPNRWGFYDMIGNCPELVLDRRGTPSYAGGTAVDPRGPETGDKVVAMGGHALSVPNNCCVWSVFATEALRDNVQDATGARFAVAADMTSLADTADAE